MKIKEIYLKKYGPLQEASYHLPGNFTVFSGSNEQGKTLTIDALVKMLLGKKDARRFTNINRVEEQPEGYVLLSVEEGASIPEETPEESKKAKEWKIPEKGLLPNLVNLTAPECENIFYIRQSRLDIREEGQFYTGVTNRITGLRSEEIDQIMGNLRQQACLTPTGAFSDVQPFKLKSRLEEAEKLAGEIDQLEKSTRDEGYDRLEEELVKSRERREIIGYRLEEMEKARLRDLYQKNRQAFNDLTRAREKYLGLDHFTEEEEQRWKNAEAQIEGYLEEKQKKQNLLQEQQEKLEKTEEQLKKKQKEEGRLTKNKEKIDQDIRPALNACAEAGKKKEQQEEKCRRFQVPALIFTVLLFLSLVSTVITPAAGTILLSLVLLGVSLLFWWPRFSLGSAAARFKGSLEEVKTKVASLGIQAPEKLEALQREIEKFLEAYTEKTREVQDLQTEAKSLQNRVNELQNEEIPTLENRLEKYREERDTIKRNSGVETREDYSQKLQEKQQQEKSIGEQKKLLESYLGTGGSTLEKNLAFWNDRVAELSSYGEAAPGVTYDHRQVNRLKKEDEDLREKEETLEEKIKAFQENLAALERKVNQLFSPEEESDYLPCRTTVDLQVVKEKLINFCREYQEIKDAAEMAMEIFRRIQGEEKEKVGELFGEDSEVSRYFREITGGRYQAVFFDGEKERITVQHQQGVRLDAEQLSGGAYDQLYFSVRLALGEKLLQGRKGFFILDDPFIKSDYGRVQKQMESLKKICGMGWQVLYFTAKKEVQEALNKDIQAGEVKLLEVKGLQV